MPDNVCEENTNIGSINNFAIGIIKIKETNVYIYLFIFLIINI